MGSNPLGGAAGALGLTNPLLLIKEATLAAFLGLEASDILTAIEGGQITKLDDLPAFLEHQLESAVQNAEQQFGGPLWELLIRAPAGLDAAAVENGQAANAVQMVKRMLGFGLALPLLTAKLEGVLKGILGDHAPEGLLASIRELPNEIGVNFFIGTVLERIFETAVATPLEEAIAAQTHPARFDFRVIKALLTKHKLTPDQAHQYLVNIGYRAEDIDAILTLAESFLSVADLQQLYLMGRLDESQISEYLVSLGYTAEDTNRLMDLYLTRAETQGAQQLRATARGGYLESKITAGEYRQLLESVNTPAKSIDLELESADLEISWGRRQLSVANLKSLYQQQHLNDRQALAQLGGIGFTEDDALALLGTWQAERNASRVGVSIQHVLAYELGGVLTQPQALARLMETGMKPADAQLLAQNPSHFGGIYAHPISPATVLGAIREGVIDATTGRDQLVALSVDPAEADLEIAVAIAKQVRGGKPRAPHKGLTEPQVLEAFKLGLVSSTWVLSELAVIGYSDADAALLLASEQTKQSGAVPDGWVMLS